MKRIALFGLGGVGQALVKIIRRENLPIDIQLIFDRSYLKKKSVIQEIPATDDIQCIRKLKNIDAIVELIGGVSTALFVLREALDVGIPVVTANKAVLAEHGYSLFTKAHHNQAPIFFEAAVAGAIPIIKNLKETFSHEQIRKVEGILNGTTNYILSKMRTEQKNQTAILKEAQKLGFAEADPTLDITGIDATQKLALLSSLVQKKWVDYHQIHTKAIDQVQLSDIIFADRMEYQIKLVSNFEKIENNIFACTEPMLVKKGDPLWGVELENNAISFEGSYSGIHTFMGKGAGPLPTACSVLSDIFRSSRSNKSMELQEEYQALADIEDIERAAYIRIPVEDKMGVLEKISGILTANQISIASLIQDKGHSKKPQGQTDIVMITHSCRRKNLSKALALIKKEPYVTGETIHIVSRNT